MMIDDDDDDTADDDAAADDDDHHDSVVIFRASMKPCPAAGTLEMAAKPLGTSANFKPADGDK